ncbi:MAG: (2Fe-2S)-binding protein [Deltaproteobacteria bacterium]|nr:(2Fe-2S)-binding protein [Deltaproteobacteria bacterium]
MSHPDDPTKTLLLDGERVAFAPGETLLEVARRAGREIPTLCHDPRLAPAGACRSCLVEVAGQRRLAPSCATPASSGLEVQTASERVLRHRRALFALYLADHPAAGETDRVLSPSEVHTWAAATAAPTDWPRLAPQRAGRDGDRNPYIRFRPELCILCARCTRYCEEVEGVSAITLAGRGSHTTIATADNVSLLDSSCELCGGCIDVCPTGAMAEKLPLAYGPPVGKLEQVRTTCNYCGVGCQLDLEVDRGGHDGRGKVLRVLSPPPGTTTNDGNLCVKGRFAYDFIDHPDRLTTPLVRAEDGTLREASWDEALRRAADGLLGVKARHGADSLGIVSSSRCTGEENYLAQKLARAVLGTNNIHQCAAT